jgi:SAM-dependent methyltransferase
MDCSERADRTPRSVLDLPRASGAATFRVCRLERFCVRSVIRVSLAVAALAAASAAHAQLEALNPPPIVVGKDVAWVPTPDAAVHRMLAMAAVGPRDLVYDLGSGDGKIAIAAAKRFGARAVGVEYSPDMVEASRASAQREGVADRVRFRQADLFDADFREATVVTLYLLTTLNVKLRPRILEMRPGTRVVSHMFRMGDWEPDESARVGSSDLYFWVVPARVAGTWAVERGLGPPLELVLDQKYQQLSGGARLAGETLPLAGATLRGDAIRIEFRGERGERQVLAGRVEGERMIGEPSGTPWSATRVRVSTGAH